MIAYYISAYKKGKEEIKQNCNSKHEAFQLKNSRKDTRTLRHKGVLPLFPFKAGDVPGLFAEFYADEVCLFFCVFFNISLLTIP